MKKSWIFKVCRSRCGGLKRNSKYDTARKKHFFELLQTSILVLCFFWRVKITIMIIILLTDLSLFIPPPLGDRWMTCDFTSVILGQWEDDNERLCAMEPRLRLNRSSLQAGLELTTARSVGHRLTHWATDAWNAYFLTYWNIYRYVRK